jgi:hypothetical protein
MHYKRTIAVKRMRELTQMGVPFSIVYLTYNRTTGLSNGFKREDNCLLRTGYRKSQSKLSKYLIAYENTIDKTQRQFHIATLLQFNNIKLMP